MNNARADMLAAGTVRVATDIETATDRVVAKIATLRQHGVLPLRHLFMPSFRPCPVPAQEILAQRRRAAAGFTLPELLIAITALVALVAVISGFILLFLCGLHYLMA